MKLFAPTPDNELSRVLAVLDHDVLDTTFDPTFDVLVRRAASICRTPISLVSFMAADRQHFKARVGLSVCSTTRDVAFCAHAIMRQELFIVPDALLDEGFKNNPLVTGEPHVRFYAGMPIIDARGHALGTVCVIDRVPRNLTDEQCDSLRALAKEVMKHLDLVRTLKPVPSVHRSIGNAQPVG